MEKTYDVIVSGGGVAGCAAALAARRAGKTVLLIEKTLVLGGLGTIGLINLFVPMDNGRGRLIIRGMCEEFVNLSRKYGWSNTSEGWEAGEPSAPTSLLRPLFAVFLRAGAAGGNRARRGCAASGQRGFGLRARGRFADARDRYQ